MNSIEPIWTPVESRSALPITTSNTQVAGELVTADPNTWGFLTLPSGKIVVVGYANLGLSPVAMLCGNRLLVGVDEVVTSVDVDSGWRLFSYRMPSVFHEFISMADPMIVRDEIGFVAISADGKERWSFLTGGPIKRFSVEYGHIAGETIDDEPFDFAIPA